MPDRPTPGQAGEGLARELDRVVRRLRAMALDVVPADRVLATAQTLADLVAAALGEQARVVPELAPYAAADQIAVLSAEVGRAAELLDAGRSDELLGTARAALVDLRHAL